MPTISHRAIQNSGWPLRNKPKSHLLAEYRDVQIFPDSILTHRPPLLPTLDEVYSGIFACQQSFSNLARTKFRCGSEKVDPYEYGHSTDLFFNSNRLCNVAL